MTQGFCTLSRRAYRSDSLPCDRSFLQPPEQARNQLSHRTRRSSTAAQHDAGTGANRYCPLPNTTRTIRGANSKGTQIVQFHDWT